MRYPLCINCRDTYGEIRSATEVDHINPHGGDMKLFWDTSNWNGLCKSCHSKKTAKEQRNKKNGPVRSEVRMSAGPI